MTSQPTHSEEETVPTYRVPACLTRPDQPCRHRGIGSCRRCADYPPLEKPTVVVQVVVPTEEENQ